MSNMDPEARVYLVLLAVMCLLFLVAVLAAMRCLTVADRESSARKKADRRADIADADRAEAVLAAWEAGQRDAIDQHFAQTPAATVPWRADGAPGAIDETLVLNGHAYLDVT